MPRTVGIGIQDFEKVIERNVFYVDKTMFIKEWWESMDDVTLITRPRRFGKTLTMSMVEHFFSIRYENSILFRNLKIWNETDYKKLQGQYPVISISFADIKERTYEQARKKIGEIIVDLYNTFDFLLDKETMNEKEKAYFQSIRSDMEEYELSISINDCQIIYMLIMEKK